VEFLELNKAETQYDLEKISQKYFQRLCLNLYLLFMFSSEKDFRKEFYTPKIKRKVLIKPISTWCLKPCAKRILYGFYFWYIKSFLFLIKLDFTKFFKKRRNIVLCIGFSIEKRCELSKRKENRVLRVWLRSFKSWHLRTSMVPYMSLSKKRFSKVIIFLLFLSEWFCPSLGRQGRCVPKGVWTCVSYFVTRVLLCNRLPV